MKIKRKLILWITAVMFVLFILPIGIAYFIYCDTFSLLSSMIIETIIICIILMKLEATVKNSAKILQVLKNLCK